MTDGQRQNVAPDRAWTTALTLIAWFGLCWWGMQAVHEAGHVLAAWATGGTVTKVVLHPTTISRTDVGPNPAPLAVVWGGPVVGVLFPALAAVLVPRRFPGPFLTAWFFAAYCLVANGAYIGLGLFDPVGDAKTMLRLGSPAWALGLFGLLAGVAGAAITEKILGRWFGIVRLNEVATWRLAGGCGLILAVLLAAELALSDPI